VCCSVVYAREKEFRADSESYHEKKASARVVKLLWMVEVCSLMLELADNGHGKFSIIEIFLLIFGTSN